MSASLVGSEMCIRDSSLGCAVRAPPRRDRAVGPPGCLPAGVGVGPLWTCLLYTSDAADDM
eukprot:14698151-Alexandrium_andersonii.AAC.1